MKKFKEGCFVYANTPIDDKKVFIGEIVKRTKKTIEIDENKLKIHSYNDGEFVFIKNELIAFA